MSIARNLTQFRAVYCSGAFIPSPEAVVALSLLFEKVHLPNNIELVQQFAAKYQVASSPPAADDWSISVKSPEGVDPFADLPVQQQRTAKWYIERAIRFAHTHAPLFGEVFESELFPNNEIVGAELIKKGKPGELNTYRVSFATDARMTGGDAEYFPKLIREGYVPVVGHFPGISIAESPDAVTAKHLATLLAMKSIEMVLPRTQSAHPEVILEARERLRDQLPPFWSSMFKASVELRKFAADSSAQDKLVHEAMDFVDRTIRPAVIDLASKLEAERKDWFYKILSPVRSGLRLLVGNPPLTQQQLVTSALVLASDTCVSVAENMRAVEALKRDSGIAYLLDLPKALGK